MTRQEKQAALAEFGLTIDKAIRRYGTASVAKLEALGLERTAAAAAEEAPDPQVAAIKKELNKALRQLAVIHDKRAELRDAARAGAASAIAALDIAPIVRFKSDERGGKEETAVVILGDWQLAKVTSSYSTADCEDRVVRLAEKIEQIVAIQREDHPVRKLHIFMVGDLIEGELIFPGQPYLLDASLFRQVCIDGPRILGNFIRRMLTIFEEVVVDGVIGNHGSIGGRQRRDYHPETNGDAMLYEVTRQVLLAGGQERLTFSANYVDLERMWYKVVDVNGRGWMLFHGDQARGGNGISGLPFPTLTAKTLKWGNGGIKEQFDFVVCGHYHTPTRMTIGSKTLWMSGSTESDSSYASEFFAAQCEPSQWLLFVTEKGNIGGEYLIRL